MEQPANQQTTSATSSNDHSNSKINTEPVAAQPRDQANGQMSRPGRGRWCSVISPPVPCPVLRRRKRREPVGRPDSTRLTSPPAVAARARPPRARHLLDGQACSCRAQRSRRCAGVVLGVQDHVVARSHSPPLTSLDSTAGISRRMCRVEIHASFPSRGATSP